MKNSNKTATEDGEEKGVVWIRGEKRYIHYWTDASKKPPSTSTSYSETLLSICFCICEWIFAAISSLSTMGILRTSSSFS